MNGDGRVARLEGLWLRYLAGETAVQAELAAELRAGGPLAETLVADEGVHRLLEALGRSAGDEPAFVQRVDALVAAEASVERFVSDVDRRIDAGRARRRRRLLLIAPVVAAAAALIVWLRPTRPPAPLAPAPAPAIVVSGALTAGGQWLRPGQPVPEGTSVSSEQGRSCLRLADASQVCLESASRLRLVRAGRLALEAGKVAAGVAHQRAGATFVIGTPVGDVTAVGTAFSVDLARDGAVTRVLQGTVRVDGRGMLEVHQALSSATGARWRMTAEEEREEWSLLRPPATVVARAPQPAAVAVDAAEAKAAPADPTALLQLADALRARGRLRDAQGICDALARQYPGRQDIDRLAAELRLPPPPQPWNATPALYRINAGGDRYLDPRGNVWAADSHFGGGHDNIPAWEEIDGTDMDPLYQSERFAFAGEKLSYDLPVPEGTYVVRLHFAEIWAATVKRNMRRFDVLVEGEKVLSGYDIAADVGPMTATVKQVVTTVQDRVLNIDFQHVVENPKISAIEVLALAPGEVPPPAPAPPTVFPPLPLPPTDALYRVNVGGREYVDPHGRRWEADNYFNDTGLGDAQNVEISGTDLAPLYRTQRRSLIAPTRRLAYSFPVAPGRYLLRLHFAELDPAAAVGSTSFDVLVEGAEAIKGLDIFSEVGVRAALVKDVETAVTDGALDLAFRPIAGRPKIAGIEVIPLTPAPVAPSAGGGCALGGRPAAWPAWPFLALFLALFLARATRRARR